MRVHEKNSLAQADVSRAWSVEDRHKEKTLLSAGAKLRPQYKIWP